MSSKDDETSRLLTGSPPANDNQIPRYTYFNKVPSSQSSSSSPANDNETSSYNNFKKVPSQSSSSSPISPTSPRRPNIEYYDEHLIKSNTNTNTNNNNNNNNNNNYNYNNNNNNTYYDRNLIKFPHNHKKAKYAVVKQDANIKDFIDNHLFEGELRLPKPQAIIYVTGGAKFFEVDSTLDSVIRRGLIKAASKLHAWIIDGGMKAGVMKYIGKCVKTMSMESIKCIGIATLCKVNNHEQLIKNEAFEYYVDPKKNRHQDLDHNHSHFILVDSEKKAWGEEIPFLDALQATLAKDYNIPVISVAINGGYTALDIIANSIQQQFSTIIIEGTGRACDAIGELVHLAQKHKLPPADTFLETITSLAVEGELTVWNALWAEVIRDGYHAKKDMDHTKPLVDKILNTYDKLTFFDPYEVDSQGLDSIIYKCLLSKVPVPTGIPVNNSVGKRLINWIRWTDDPDWLNIMLCKEINKVENPAEILGDALAYALLKNRWFIFDVLCDFHAQFNKPLSYLYEHDSFRVWHTERMTLRNLIPNDAFLIPPITDRVPTNHVGFNMVLDILSDVGPVSTVYANLCSQHFTEEHPEEERMSEFVDVLIWAILMNYTELARVIWKRTRYPLHSALLVCNFEFRAHEYLENADWYEREAVKILNSVDYLDAKKKLIKFNSPRMFGKATLEDLASEGCCKLVMAHPHMQQHFDEMLYSYKKSAVIGKKNRNNIWLVFLIFTFLPQYCIKAIQAKIGRKPRPTTIVSTKPRMPSDASHYPRGVGGTWSSDKMKSSYQNEKKHKKHDGGFPTLVTMKVKPDYLDKNPEDHFHIFYSVPIVKFWTSTIFYLMFLILQAGYVLLNFKAPEIQLKEYCLWLWIAAMILEEVLEITNEHSRGYFHQFTNQIDIGLIVLHVVYIGLRITQVFFTNDPTHWSGAVNSLQVASVLSWLRLMSVFPVSSTFGPLFFILIRLVGDLMIWFVLFTIFAISFQIGFASLAIQAGVDPTLPYPHPNGTFPISLVTIVGEWSYLVDVMYETPTGVMYLTIYAFIVQVMFINLLIAMMGSTYATVKENSDVEWKYYRCGFVRDTMTVSTFPPPLNVLELFRMAYKRINKTNKKKGIKEYREKKEAIRMDQMSKTMRVSLDKIRAEDEHDASQSPLVQIKIVKKEGRDLRAILDKHQNLMTSMMESILQIKSAMKISEDDSSSRPNTPLFSTFRNKKGKAPASPLASNKN